MNSRWRPQKSVRELPFSPLSLGSLFKVAKLFQLHILLHLLKVHIHLPCHFDDQLSSHLPQRAASLPPPHIAQFPVCDMWPQICGVLLVVFVFGSIASTVAALYYSGTPDAVRAVTAPFFEIVACLIVGPVLFVAALIAFAVRVIGNHLDRT